jgi:hypothetical protein
MSKAKKVKEEAQNVPRGYDDTFEMDANDLEALASQIRKDLIEAEADKNEWLQERIKDTKAYFGIKKETDWPFKGAAKISSQMHRIMVDTTAANLVSSANAPENILTATTLKSQSIESAKYTSDLHNGLARNEYMLPEVLDRSWHKGLIESFCVLKPIYQFEIMETVNTVKRWLPADYDTKGIKYDSDTDTVYGEDGTIIHSLSVEQLPSDDAELEALNLHECNIEVTTEHAKEGIKVLCISGEHIFLPVSSPGETPYEMYQRAPYVIEDEYKTIQEMQMLQDAGKLKNIELLCGRMTDNLTADELRQIKENQSGVFDITKHARHVVRNIWWNGKYEYKGKLRELQVYMNADTSTILKVKINTFGIRPYFPQVPFPVDGTPFGESLPKKLRPLITELELAMNTVINMGLIKAYPPKFFDPSGGFDPKTVGGFGPNSYIPVRDPQHNVFMPPQPEDPRILMEMIKLIMDLIERTAANSDAVQGQVSPTANTTAFEVQQSLVRAGVRFDLIYRRLKGQLQPMFKYINKLVLRFMPMEKEVQIMGEQAVIKDEQGQEFSRLQMIHKQEGEYGLTLTGNSITDEQMEAQKAEKLFMMMNQDPYLTYKPEAPYYLRFNLIKHYNPIMMDKILPKPEEVAQLLRDRQQTQNEQEQMAIEDGKKHSDPSAQMQAQMMQMELQLKAQQAQLDAQSKQQQMELDLQKQQADMHMKEKEHDQKMRQLEEAHRLKLEMMRTESDAKAKAIAKTKPANPNA